jgi:hypothetical protein
MMIVRKKIFVVFILVLLVLLLGLYTCLCINGSSCNIQKTKESIDSNKFIIYQPLHPVSANSSTDILLNPEEVLTNTYSNGRRRVGCDINTNVPRIINHIDFSTSNWDVNYVSDNMHVLPNGSLVYSQSNNTLQIGAKLLELQTEKNFEQEQDTWPMSTAINSMVGIIAYNRNRIYCIDDTGNVQWERSHSELVSATYLKNRWIPKPEFGINAITFVYLNKIIRIDYQGNILNNYNLPAITNGNTYDNPPAIDAQDITYICDSQGRLYALRDNAKLKWSTPPIIRADQAYEFEVIGSGPCVRFDHSILIGTIIGVFAYNYDGSLKWHYVPSYKSQMYKYSSMGILRNNDVVLSIRYNLDDGSGWHNQFGILTNNTLQFVSWPMTYINPEFVITKNDMILMCYNLEKDNDSYLALYSTTGYCYWMLDLGDGIGRIIGVDDAGKVYVFLHSIEKQRKQILIIN